MKRFYRVDETSKIFDVSDKTVYRLLGSGELLALRIRGSIRIPRSEIERYIKEKYAEFAEKTGTDVDNYGLDSEKIFSNMLLKK